MPPNIKDLKLTSPDIEANGRIADRHAANHGNVAPRLIISGVPQGAVELAVICHDPDAPLARGFTHWVVYGVPPQTREISHGGASFRVGPNGAGQTSWYGPQPPKGHGAHHYYFWVYALSRKVDGAPTREEFLARYGDAIIEQNRLVATYSN